MFSSVLWGVLSSSVGAWQTWSSPAAWNTLTIGCPTGRRAELVEDDDIEAGSSSPCGHAWSTSGATITPHPAITCPQALSPVSAYETDCGY